MYSTSLERKTVFELKHLQILLKKLHNVYYIFMRLDCKTDFVFSVSLLCFDSVQGHHSAITMVMYSRVFVYQKDLPSKTETMLCLITF